MKSLRNIGIVTAILGALASLGIMTATASSVGSLSDLLVLLGFYVWVALPFVLLIALTFYIHRKGASVASHIAILLTSILVVVSSVFIYWASIFDSESSTSALVFVFIPIYALFTTAVLYGVAWLLLKALMPSRFYRASDR